MRHEDGRRVILASRSPERIALIGKLFPRFEVVPADINESRRRGEPVLEMVMRLACEKARSVSQKEHGFIIAADTMIEFEDQALGKPPSEDEARDMLGRLSGARFHLYTATAVVIESGESKSHLSDNLMEMRQWRPEELDAYLAGKRWAERAGGFSIADKDCPAKLLEGELDAVRGLSTAWLGRFA